MCGGFLVLEAWPCRRAPLWGVLGGVGGLFGFCIVDASVFVVFVVLVCEASCKGHMVDALASRADEGRRSLR